MDFFLRRKGAKFSLRSFAKEKTSKKQLMAVVLLIVVLKYNVDPRINEPHGCLIGGVPFKKGFITCGGTHLNNHLWGFINPGLTLSMEL